MKKINPYLNRYIINRQNVIHPINKQIMCRKENINITGRHGFVYAVCIEHYAYKGLSFAFFEGSIIADAQLSRITEPHNDDDTEWEMYEDRFAEWRDEIISILKPACEKYFES